MEERFRNLDYQNWKPVRTLGTDSYGTVYEIARDDGFGMVDHAALKVLSIPAAPEDFDALVAEGRTPEEVTAGELRPRRNTPQKVSKAPAPAPVQTAAAQEEKERQILENERWMKAFLTNQKKESS